MQKKRMNKALSSILCIVLVVAMALCTTGCKNNAKNEAVLDNNIAITEGAVIGEGSTAFQFTVVDKEGKEVNCTVNTDEKTVGAALLALDVIAGDESEYGLYVKTVNGITADYDVDGTYWAFYIDGEYAMTGVDSTDVVAGATYAFKVEK